MKRAAAILVARMLFALVLFSWGAVHAQQPLRIVAIGGSSTLGQGVDRADSYPAKLERALKAKGYRVSVANAGVSGDKTADGLARMDQAVPKGTHVAIVEFGINDHFAGVSRETIRNNLETMLSRLKERGVEILLIGQPSVNMKPLADRHGAGYADFGFPDNGNQRYRLADDPQLRTRGMAHFNAAGYDMIVARIMPEVERLMAKVKR